MIVFDLQCLPSGHRFEGWFGSSADYDDQQTRGLVSCPMCGTSDVSKAVMAPNVGRKGNQVTAPVASPDPSSPTIQQPMANTPLPPEAVAMLKAVAAMQTEALKSSTWVGEKFTEDARAMHYGEKDVAPIHGRATLQQAQELAEEGIPVAPVLVPVIPPEESN
jgi:hypothetical protein